MNTDCHTRIEIIEGGIYDGWYRLHYYVRGGSLGWATFRTKEELLTELERWTQKRIHEATKELVTLQQDERRIKKQLKRI